MELTKKESAQYMKIVQEGNMDDMFDFAWRLGWKKAMEKVVKESEAFFKSRSN